MVTARRPRRFTLAEYLRLERDAPFKSEFERGEIFAMVGGTMPHSLVTANAIRVLGVALAGETCRVFDSNLRLYVATADIMTYPDAMVICGAPRFFEDGPKDTVVNPTAIVEVLSPSTEAYDRGEKFVAYRTLESLQYYLLIDPRTPRVEIFSAPNWVPVCVTGLDATAHLAGMQATLALSQLYIGVDL